MSFLADPPMLIGTGAVAARLAGDDERAVDTVAKVTLAVFLVTSISLYFNARWTDWLAKLCRAESGRDWMLNSGVLNLDHRNVSPSTHLAAAAIFATYPLWFRLGVRLARRPTR